MPLYTYIIVGINKKQKGDLHLQQSATQTTQTQRAATLEVYPLPLSMEQSYWVME